MQINKTRFQKNLASLAILSSVTFLQNVSCAQPNSNSALDLSQYKTNEEVENALPDILKNYSRIVVNFDGSVQTAHLPDNNQMVNAVANSNRQAHQRMYELSASGMSPEAALQQVLGEIEQGKFIGDIPSGATFTDGCNIV